MGEIFGFSLLACDDETSRKWQTLLWNGMNFRLNRHRCHLNLFFFHRQYLSMNIHGWKCTKLTIFNAWKVIKEYRIIEIFKNNQFEEFSNSLWITISLWCAHMTNFIDFLQIQLVLHSTQNHPDKRKFYFLCVSINWILNRFLENYQNYHLVLLPWDQETFPCSCFEYKNPQNWPLKNSTRGKFSNYFSSHFLL